MKRPWGLSQERPFLFFPMKTIFYIDGFNLYYGCCRRDGKKYRWLDITELCRRLIRDAEIVAVKYFTARIIAPVASAINQAAYLDALRTLPKVEIIEGRFLTTHTEMPLVSAPSQTVNVIKHEEKGTDVNIACHMVIDALHGKCERLALISNDSDLVYPIRYVREETGLPVQVFNPQRRPSYHLKQAATKMQKIHTNTLIGSRLPDTVTDSDGAIITKPPHW